MPCTCTPVEKHGYHYAQWIGSAFQTCAWTPRDVAAFCIGLGNIGFWMFAQVPQLWANYKNQSVESLSGMFLTLWLVGDITNFVGCITTNQSPVQLYTSIYFLCMDVLTLGQYYYYYRKSLKDRHESRSLVDRKRGVGDSAHTPGQKDDVDIHIGSSLHQPVNGFSPGSQKKTLFAVLFAVLVFARHSAFVDSFAASSSASAASHATSAGMSVESYMPEPLSRVGRVLLSLPEHSTSSATSSFDASTGLFKAFEAELRDPQPGDCNYVESLGIVAKRIGTVSAWLSGFIYLTSRLPQIIRNHQRKSTEGLSLGMFVLAMLGNTCYGISLLLPDGADLSSSDFFMNTFPYLVGSLGTNISAIIILLQAWIYRNNRAPVDIDMDPETTHPFTTGLTKTERQLSQTILV